MRLALLLILSVVGYAQPSDNGKYKLSVASVAAAQSWDFASSYGLYESNPLLGPKGRFGTQQGLIGVGATAISLVAQYVIIRHYPHTRRMFTVLNFLHAGASVGVMTHNWAIQR